MPLPGKTRYSDARMDPLIVTESIDLPRMRGERFAKLQAAMESENVDD